MPTKEQSKIVKLFSTEYKWLLVGDTYKFTRKRSLNSDPSKTDEENKANEESIRLGVRWISTPTGRKLLSEKGKERTEKGLNKGWAYRGRSLMSYPERYWKGVLDNLSLTYVQEFVVNRQEELGLKNKLNFFLDFLLVSPKGHLIDLEIDGKQHNYPEREAKDITRALELKEAFSEILGEPFYIYRIPWVNPINENSKKIVEGQIRSFEDFFYSH